MIITDPYRPLYPIVRVYNLVIPAQNGYKVIFVNDSSLNTIIKFANGATSYMPANDRRLYKFVGEMEQPNFNIEVTAQQLIIPVNTANRFIMEVYAPDECITENYPMPLIRGINLVPSH